MHDVAKIQFWLTFLAFRQVQDGGQDFAVKEHNGVLCLALRRCRDLALQLQL